MECSHSKEARTVISIDIGGAFLNADISRTGIPVHMRLDKTMTDIIVELDHEYRKYVCSDGSVVVRLDKALYGTVEAASLWYENISG
jgi:hypothetical protein